MAKSQIEIAVLSGLKERYYEEIPDQLKWSKILFEHFGKYMLGNPANG